MRRIGPILFLLAVATVVGIGRAAALEVTCIEASKYKHLYKIFGGDARKFAAYLQIDPGRLPGPEHCRAALISGKVEPPSAQDVAKLADIIVQNEGWLATLHLSSTSRRAISAASSPATSGSRPPPRGRPALPFSIRRTSSGPRSAAPPRRPGPKARRPRRVPRRRPLPSPRRRPISHRAGRLISPSSASLRRCRPRRPAFPPADSSMRPASSASVSCACIARAIPARMPSSTSRDR